MRPQRGSGASLPKRRPSKFWNANPNSVCGRPVDLSITPQPPPPVVGSPGPATAFSPAVYRRPACVLLAEGPLVPPAKHSDRKAVGSPLNSISDVRNTKSIGNRGTTAAQGIERSRGLVSDRVPALIGSDTCPIVALDGRGCGLLSTLIRNVGIKLLFVHDDRPGRPELRRRAQLQRNVVQEIVMPPTRQASGADCGGFFLSSTSAYPKGLNTLGTPRTSSDISIRKLRYSIKLLSPESGSGGFGSDNRNDISLSDLDTRQGRRG